jgi:glutathione S-transferase
MYTLYYAPGACSLAVQVKLQAIGEPYQRISLNLKQLQHLTEEFQRVNPLQRVPVLEVNGEYFSEAMALLLFLEQRHPQGLLPEAPQLLARVLQKMNWLSNTLHIDFAALWRPLRFSQDASVQQQLSAEARPRLVQHFVAIDKELSATGFWLSEQLTLADYYLLPFLRWGNIVIAEVSGLTAIQSYLARVAELPEVKAALELEAITLLAKG